MRKAYLPKNIQFIFFSLLLLLAVNFFFRAILFALHLNLASTATFSDILYCFFNMGLRFDLYISLIILVLPFTLCAIPFLSNRNINPFLSISNWIIILLALINFALSATDLGFFKYYNSRVTNTIFDYTDDIGLMLKVMMNDSTYLPYFGLFIIVGGVYIFPQLKLYKRIKSKPTRQFKLASRITIILISLGLMFFGIRSSFYFRRAPLRFSDAYFSENLFLNQLSFNPVYYFAHSYLDVKIEYFDSETEEINTALRYLNRRKSNLANPFTVQVDGSDSTRPNIIFVFLESMSNAMVSRYNPEFNTTPFLDSLANQAVVFDHFFSAGVHTHNAIFTAFYGLPAIMHNTPMSTLATARMKFYGLPQILKEKDYQNQFYVTGSKSFDNMNDFLLLNGFDKVIGDSDYPADSIFNNWGVTDKTMFNRVLHDCDSLYDLNNHFFMSVLTISAHEGYRVPKSYKEKISNEIYPYNLYELSDLVLKEFIHSAQKKEWFKNTVFVIVGDHGQNFSAVYDMNLNYHQVPLLIYSPDYIDPVVYNDPGLQQDIYPTLFGLLDFSYVNNAFGVDLFKHKRKYAYFSADTKFGIIDNKLFLIYRGGNNISMYNYNEKSISDVFVENRAKADSMMRYGFSMMQSAKYLINNKLTDISGIPKQTD